MCGKAGCEEFSVIRQGNQFLCKKHYRFVQMRSSAKRQGKHVPSHLDLEIILASQGMFCSDCRRPMNWRSADGRATVLTLQHYRDGSIAFACLSCNSRHASMPADTFRDMDPGHKHCPSCDQIKPASEFTKDSGRSGELRRKSKCRTCSDKSTKFRRESNREKYNAYQREYRAKRKAAGKPVASGS